AGPPHLRMSARGPDPGEARRRYDASAGSYERVTWLLDRPRRLALEKLAARPGETVLDVACGTGRNLAALREAVGPRGRVVGVDISARMLDVARERVAAAGWENVELLEADLTSATLPPADAALLSFTHDVLRMEPAVQRLVEALGDGGRVAAAGVKYAPRRALPVNLAVRLVARRFVTTFEGLDAPWSLLAAAGVRVEVRPLLLGALYVAWGRVDRA
ncbi:MAG TPA: methyltransferase domain-containing protein, partial [Solirubrobacteraceae bacterium]|nr:methyltransferase domain-containing protein [Solirubrobacteraceae bacterium]